NRFGFAVAEHDASRPLVIDPIIDFTSGASGSTSLDGGTVGGDPIGLGIAVDGAGNAYITGKTTGSTISSEFGSRFGGGGFDVFARKYAPDGTVVYTTFVGGGNDDQGNGIAVDLAGDAYVIGTTASSDFPTTSGAYHTTFGGGDTDAMVFKLNATGDALLY